MQSVIQFDNKHDLESLSSNRFVIKKKLEHGKYYDLVIKESNEQEITRTS